MNFKYSQDFVQLDQQISVHVKNDQLSRVLNRMLTPLQVRYEGVGNQVFLKKTLTKADAGAQLSETGKSFASNPNIVLTGQVTSGAGDPLPGVTVVLKGTTIGTSTDNEGRYTINVPDENGTLVFSFIGFVSQEIVITGQQTINVTMQEDQQALQEVVVVGYGTQKRERLRLLSRLLIQRNL